jgi:hypothetical protein
MHGPGKHADIIGRINVTDTRKIRLGAAETILGLSWFLLDGGWLMGWRWLSYPLIVVAVGSAIARFIWIEKERDALHVAASECAWLAMNAFWIVGDFESIPWCITTAKICLLAGLLILARAFLISRGGVQSLLFRPIRRLRVFLHSEPKM